MKEPLEYRKEGRLRRRRRKGDEEGRATKKEEEWRRRRKGDDVVGRAVVALRLDAWLEAPDLTLSGLGLYYVTSEC